MRDSSKLSLRFVGAIVAALLIGASCGLLLTLTLAIGLFY